MWVFRLYTSHYMGTIKSGLWGVVSYSCVYAFSAFGQVDDNTHRRQTELDNIRALPFGYTVFCEKQVLKIKSSRSATFVIRDSQLCLAASRHSSEKVFILCSNDPKQESDDGADSMPTCSSFD